MKLFQKKLKDFFKSSCLLKYFNYICTIITKQIITFRNLAMWRIKEAKTLSLRLIFQVQKDY